MQRETQEQVDYDLIGDGIWQDLGIALSITLLATAFAILVLILSGHSLIECLQLPYLI